MNFFFENLSLVPETRAPKEHFKLLFGSGTSSPAKIRPLKVGPPAINWKSSLYENFHPWQGAPRPLGSLPSSVGPEVAAVGCGVVVSSSPLLVDVWRPQ